jgi:hypothetical protein
MPDIIKIDSKATAKRLEEAERVPIFEIDGTVYDIPNVARADIGLAYVNRVIEEGEDAATANLIIDTMGDDAFEALRGVVGLEPEDWRGIQEKIQGIVNPKARGNRAARRA